jgi:para-nitrobenzyl esterase
MKFIFVIVISLFMTEAFIKAQSEDKNSSSPLITTANGVIEGINDSGVDIFKGIPYAQPPVGSLRWKPPQPVKNWSGIRKAKQFGPGCLQLPIFGDMKFRFPKKSEDCLYLNIWTPANRGNIKLPVLVYFFGGGFLAGDGSEYRYDGESMARNEGIVAVTVNYRLNVFGFFAYPGLTKESPNHASGNYGLLDQVQALRWVKQNIAAFGGDPDKITIAGESAGSMSVSGLMASPLSKNLFQGAVGESGGLFGPLSPVSLSKGEERGMKFAKMVGAHNLSELRKIPADSLLKATAQRGAPYFSVIIDGYFLPDSPEKIFVEGKQAHVPLLLGWNSEESSYRLLLSGKKPTPENFISVIKDLYGNNADQVLKIFPHANDKEVIESGNNLASDRFTAFSTWKWGDLQTLTGDTPVYMYYYSHPRPAMKDNSNQNGPTPSGAVHSAEIEYVMGNLPTNRVYDWQPEDYKVSHIFQDFVANFVKKGNPNGMGLPVWKPLNQTKTRYIMHIDVNTRLEPVQHRKQMLLLDRFYK